MKKTLIFILILVAFPNNVLAQISSSAYYDGYWGKWNDEIMCTAFGNYSGFTIYWKTDHPSNYLFKFQIESYFPPSKDMIKSHYKNQVPFEYSGYVEYFVSDYYPTIKSALQAVGFAFVKKEDGNIRTSKAIIKILPYKKHPRCYNILFEGIAIGIDLGRWEFNN